MLRAGTLNRRVRIERPNQVKKPSGQVVANGWAEVATVWADIRAMNGREFASSGAAQTLTTTSIRVRYRTGIDTTMRCVDVVDGQVYDIVAVLPDKQRREHVDLACQSGVRRGGST